MIDYNARYRTEDDWWVRTIIKNDFLQRSSYGPYVEFYNQIREIPSIGSIGNRSWMTVYEPHYLAVKMQEYHFELDQAKDNYKNRMIDLSGGLNMNIVDDNKEIQTWLDLLSSLGG